MFSHPTTFFLNKEIRKAAKAECWMLTFSGICVALEVMAQDYYFNKVFKMDKENNIEPIIERYPDGRIHSLSWDPKTFQKIWDDFKRINSGMIFRYLLADLKRLDKSEVDALWVFRSKMAHEFSPHDLQISHEKNALKDHIFSTDDVEYESNDLRKVFLREGKVTTLHLPNFYWFYKGIYDNYPPIPKEATTEEQMMWLDVRGKLTVTLGSKEIEKGKQPISSENLAEERREPFEKLKDRKEK